MFNRQPDGFTLRKADGRVRNRIRGDLLPSDCLVIVHDGVSFVRTGDKEDGFLVYVEGHKTREYISHGE